MANSGYGQATPDDSSDEFTVAAFIVRQMMAEMSTMKLVQVNAVTGGGVAPAGTVTVTPLVSQIDGNGYGTPHEKIPPIPWSRVQGGKNAIICDPQVGDIGYVVASDRDISIVKSTLKAALPGSRRQFDIADGIYVGGCLNVAPTAYVMFTTDGHLQFVDVDGNMLVSSAAGWTATPKTGGAFIVNGTLVVKQNLQLAGTIESDTGGTYTGDIKTGGNVIAGTGSGDQVGLKSHTHTSGGAGTQTSAPTAGT